MNGRILYKEVCASIVQAIRSGRYKPGELLPPQQELCTQYGVSLITMKKAITLAEQQGYVIRRKGRRAEVAGTAAVRGSRCKVLLLDILGNDIESVKRIIPANIRFGNLVEEGWNSIIRHSILSALPPETEVFNGSYYRDEIFNNFENTLLAHVDRVAIFGGITENLIRLLRECGKQVVVFGNYRALNVCCVYNDDRASCFKAIKYLISLGHRRIAYIGSATSGGDFAERYKGYQDAMTAAGLPISGYLVRWCKLAIADEGYAKMSDMLYSSTVYGLPSAVFCADDNIAYGALMAIRESQLRCPEDISVVGVNNYKEICESTSPKLSSIEKNFHTVGLKFAEILQRERWEEDSTVVKCDFVIRESIQENHHN